jgi:hypothetical protein
MMTEFAKLYQLIDEIEKALSPQKEFTAKRRILKAVLQTLSAISKSSMKFQKWTADPRELLYQLLGELESEGESRWGNRIHDILKEN